MQIRGKKKIQIPTAWAWSLHQMTSGTKAADTFPESTKWKDYFRILCLPLVLQTQSLSRLHTHTPLPSQIKGKYTQGSIESNNYPDLDVLEKPCTCCSK